MVKLANLKCGACGKKFERDVVLDTSLPAFSLSSVEKAQAEVGVVKGALCPKCDAKFFKWINAKGYGEKDCWCSHMDEFIDEVS